MAALALAAAKKSAANYGVTVKTGIKAARKIADAFQKFKRDARKGPLLAKVAPKWKSLAQKAWNTAYKK